MKLIKDTHYHGEAVFKRPHSWAKLNPEIVVRECSSQHIENLLKMMQADLATYDHIIKTLDKAKS